MCDFEKRLSASFNDIIIFLSLAGVWFYTSRDSLTTFV